MSTLLRVIMVALIIWGIWRIYVALYPPPPRRQVRVEAQDEWHEVLDAIDELPETVEPHRRAQEHDTVFPHQSDLPQDAVAKEGIESVIVQEAEMALALVQEGDEHERLAAYHEIAIYDKLCSMADGHISEATRQTIDDIHQRALKMICPPDEDG